MEYQNFGIAIHGGAGTIVRESMSPEMQAGYEDALKRAVEAGFSILSSGGTSLDAVEAAVVLMEDCPLFNAGKGAVFNNQGAHEMDAAIMYGKTLEAGAICGVRNIKNPVKLARAVMQNGRHVMLGGAGAEDFARQEGLDFEEDAYFFTDLRYAQWQQALAEDKVMLDHTEKKMGTVGAVALDRAGNLAAATSTGGLTNKRFGRIGDSPVIGAGTYAHNKTCAISCTGVGELFIRSVVAYDISCLMEYKGLSLREACSLVVHEKLVTIGGEGGLVAIDHSGNIEMPFNSEGMYRASHSAGSNLLVAIYK